MNIAQFIIGIPLFIVLLFGIGFIINMLIKSTWLPVILYVLLVMGIMGYIVSKGGTPHMVDYVMLLSGFLGAMASGWTIRVLRTKGYRMF